MSHKQWGEKRYPFMITFVSQAIPYTFAGTIPIFPFPTPKTEGKEMDEDLYFNSEEHLQRIPKPRAVLGGCSSDLTTEGPLDSYGGTSGQWAGSLEIPVQTMFRQHWGWW